MEAVILKPGRDKALRNRHHWIYSGAVGRLPEFENGAILPVQSAAGDLLGHAYFNRRTSITGRMVSFGRQEPKTGMIESLEKALALRRNLFDPKVTNAVRLVNAEGDGIPGLIADLYGDVLVLQVVTLGMEKLKPFLINELKRLVKPVSILERSELPARREEGLADFSGRLFGPAVDRTIILEDGLSFRVDFGRSQKTGFYLDQRENRRLAGLFARGRTVLNAFSYTGAFSVYAMKGGAVRVDSVDSSAGALELARENFDLNSVPSSSSRFYPADVFNFLREMPADEYDLVILDPPAFAKKKADVIQACRGYKEINRTAIGKMRSGGILLTFSCSHFVDEILFGQVVFQAAAEAGRRVKIIGTHRQALDHPVNIFHPETAYLKGLLLYVD